jgi:hypothetical protein
MSCQSVLNKRIDERSLAKIYKRYRGKFFPKLLENPSVLPEDKQKTPRKKRRNEAY